MSEELAVRDATEEDRDAAVELLEAAHGSKVRDAASWDWLFRGRLGGYVVADAGDRLAAQYALLPLRVRHRGEVIDGSLSLDTATHPDYGGRGLMTELGGLAYARAGTDLVLGFPNPSSAWILYNRLDWHELTPFPLVFKPLVGLATALAPRRIRTRQVIRLLARPQRRRFNAERVDRFGGWADDIWSATSDSLGTAVVRDSAHLNWRFVASPFPYERFAAEAGGEPAAFAVLRTVPWRNGSVSYLMELAAHAGAEAEARAVLEAAVSAARGQGAAGVVALSTPSNPLREVFRRAGFRTAPARVRAGFSFGARMSGALTEHAELRRLDGWHVTAGDFDHV